jgi:hypothetical protein
MLPPIRYMLPMRPIHFFSLLMLALFLLSFAGKGAAAAPKEYYIMYTTSRYCEIVKTRLHFGKDSTFRISCNCNDKGTMQYKRPVDRVGKWRMKDDSTIVVRFVKKPEMVFRILPDDRIQYQNGARSSRPTYKPE